MTYFEILLPVLQIVGFILLCFLCFAGLIAVLFGIIELVSAKRDFSNTTALLAILVGVLIIVFGIPFTIWVNTQFWPEPAPSEQKSLYEEFKQCQESGSYWYAVEQPGDTEPAYVCVNEPLQLKDLQPTP